MGSSARRSTTQNAISESAPSDSSATTRGLVQPVAWDNPADQQRLLGEIQKAQMGGIVGQTVGGIIGLMVGCVVGVLAGCFPGSIIGSLIGGVIGLDMVGGEPLRAAFFNFVGPLPTLPAPPAP